MAETSVLSELLYEVVPHWSGRIKKYLPKEEQKSTGLIITPKTVAAEKNKAEKIENADNTSNVSNRPQTPQEASTAPILEGKALEPKSALVGSGVAVKGRGFDEDRPRMRSTGAYPPPTTPPYPGPGPTPDAAAAAKAAALVEAHHSKLLTALHGTSRLDAKPDTSKSRFSSITGPVVYYDGESQHMLCDLWTALNGKRGGLRKEMMGLKRRQQMAPRFLIEVTDSDEDDDGSKKEDGEDDEADPAAEMLRIRMKMERERMKRMNRRAGGPPMGMDALPFKRARTMAGQLPPMPANDKESAEDEKLKTLLEHIDESLDKACKAAETVAFVWLKGDAYDGHLKFILSRLKDVAAKIEESGFVKKEEPAKNQPTDTKMRDVPPAAEESKMAPPANTAKPRPNTPPRIPEATRKKSDTTMRDVDAIAPGVEIDSSERTVVPKQPQRIQRKESGTSSEESKAPSMDEAVDVKPIAVEVPKEHEKTAVAGVGPSQA
ncbi:hypothetical protein BDZ91DRAFT_757811 [Kalaharituber pfeilii]|nr:hypothetical protein BDZ91DRAFT_757811 [Kalaharituber pfeilii]